MRSTYTYTRYWGAETIDELTAVAGKAEVDYLERKPHVSKDAQMAMEKRIRALYFAIELMADRADD